MNPRSASLGPLFVALALVSGCTFARIYSTSGNTVALTTLQQGESESFTLSKHMVFDYTGAVDVQELVRSKYGAGGTVENVSIKVKSTFGDFMLNLITLGLAKSKHFEVTGDYIRPPSR